MGPEQEGTRAAHRVTYKVAAPAAAAAATGADDVAGEGTDVRARRPDARTSMVRRAMVLR